MARPKKAEMRTCIDCRMTAGPGTVWYHAPKSDGIKAGENDCVCSGCEYAHREVCPPRMDKATWEESGPHENCIRITSTGKHTYLEGPRDECLDGLLDEWDKRHEDMAYRMIPHVKGEEVVAL